MATDNKTLETISKATAVPGANTPIVDEKIVASLDKQIAKLAGKREAATMVADISSIQTPFNYSSSGAICRFCGNVTDETPDVCENCGATYAVMLWVGYK